MKIIQLLSLVTSSLRGVAVPLVVVASLGATPAVAGAPAVNGAAVSGDGFSCSVEPDLSRFSCQTTAELGFVGMENFILEDPHRLVIDLRGFKVKRPEHYSLANSPVIQRIRSGQREDIARIVLDLNRRSTVSHSLSLDKRTVSFELSPVEQAPPSPPTSVPVARARGLETPKARSGDEDESTPAATEKLSVAAGRSMDVTLSRPKKESEHVLKFSVDSTFISLEPGDRPLRDVQVFNKTDKELFLRTDVQRVYDSGTPQERYENTKSLIATPRRFVLPPLGNRAVRVVVAGEPPEAGEEMYRLILSPEPRPDSEVEVTGSVDDRAAVFKVVAALGVTIALPSHDAKGVVRIDSQANQVTLVNSGTRAVLVEGCSSCPLEKDVCTASGRKLLYPNRPWSIPVVGSGVINCDLSVGKQKQKMSSFYGAGESRQ